MPWKPSNSGTELWESNLRQGKETTTNNRTVPVKSGSQWTGHTPTNHIGGTWGEEEEDSSNMWTGVPCVNSDGSHSSASSNSALRNPAMAGNLLSNVNQRDSDVISHPSKNWFPEENSRSNWASDQDACVAPLKWGAGTRKKYNV